MWAIIKIDIKKISTLKSEFINKIGGEVLFYSPKLKLICSKPKTLIFFFSLLITFPSNN